MNVKSEPHTDASKFGFGNILLQYDGADITLHPIYYASNETNIIKSKYSNYKVKCLVIITSLYNFRVYLLRMAFKIMTGYYPFVLKMKKKDLCIRIAKWALLFEKFQYTKNAVQ